MKNVVRIIVALILFGSAPLYAQNTVNDTDIFNCSTSGQATASAGSTGPLGGPYVPVADYAVELNTGLLVYKECVLRVVINQKRKAITSEFDRAYLTRFNGGRTDPTDPTVNTPFFSQEFGVEMRNLSHATRYKQLEGTTLQPLSNTIRTAVKNAVAARYTTGYRLEESLKCSYTDGDLQNAYNGRPANFWEAFSALTDEPMCNIYGATVYAETELDDMIAYETMKETQKLAWGQGVYPVERTDANGFRLTQTPGQIVLQNGIMHVQSGYEQEKTADDLGELINAYYAGVSNQVVTEGTPGSGGGAGGFGGLAAITMGGANSYMQQVVNRTAGDYVQTSANTAIALLQAALAIEQQYRAVYNDILNFLDGRKTAIRGAETNCYNIVKNAVCESGTITATGCTAQDGGGALTFTNSPSFSTTAINTAGIPALETAANANRNSADSNIAVIQSLIASVTSNPTPANQTTAINQLNNLPPHTSQNVTNAQTQREGIQGTVGAAIDKAGNDWANDQNPNVGWCNVSLADVRAKWIACWSGNTSQCHTP